MDSIHFPRVIMSFLVGAVFMHLVYQMDIIIRNPPTGHPKDLSRNSISGQSGVNQGSPTLGGSAEKWDIGRQVTTGSHRHVADDITVADKLRREVKILCWITTYPANLDTKATAVRNTWGRRCDVLLFASDYRNRTFPTIDIHPPKGYDHLTAKGMQALDFVYKHHLSDADWFVQADDDTYIIMENLRYLLHQYSPKEPVTFGKHFNAIVPGGYFSGGAGIVMSRETIKRMGERRKGQCMDDYGPADVTFGWCFKRLNITLMDSYDRLNRSRFHCFRPENHLYGDYPGWYSGRDTMHGAWGMDSISDSVISFHYVDWQMMYELEYYTYHLKPYGICNNLQNLNKLI